MMKALGVQDIQDSLIDLKQRPECDSDVERALIGYCVSRKISY